MSPVSTKGAILIDFHSAIVASTWLVYYRARILDGHDLIWKSVYQSMCAMFEMMSGVLVACMPSIAAVSRKATANLQATLSNAKKQHIPLEGKFSTPQHRHHPWEKRFSNKERKNSSKKKTSNVKVSHKSNTSSIWIGNEHISQVRIWAAGSVSSELTRTSTDAVGIRRTTEFCVETIDQDQIDDTRRPSTISQQTLAIRSTTSSTPV